MICSKKVARIAKRVRRLSYHERIELMDWLNSWYNATKERDQMLLEDFE